MRKQAAAASPLFKYLAEENDSTPPRPNRAGKCPMLVYLFIVGWTIFREFGYQQGVWPFALLNIKLFRIDPDPDADDNPKYNGISLV